VNLDQTDTDLDGLGDACDDDDDDDGYPDESELHMGTTSLIACGGTTSWPADLVAEGMPDSTNRVSILDLTSFLGPVNHLDTSLGTHPGDLRWDLVPGPGLFATDINIEDLTNLITLAPPILGGARAFDGPACQP
jgi:hypothetical protein